MSLLMIVVAIVAIVFIASTIFAALKGTRTGASGSVGYPYQPAKTLFSAAERSFLGVLDLAVGSEYRVFGKVRVADVANVKSGLGKSARQGALNRIAGKHLDFVVCRATDLALVCAIELNDKSHDSRRAQARDELLARVCQTIGLPLFTFPARRSYSPEELKARFQAVFPASAVAATAGAKAVIERVRTEPGVASQPDAPPNR